MLHGLSACVASPCVMLFFPQSDWRKGNMPDCAISQVVSAPLILSSCRLHIVFFFFQGSQFKTNPALLPGCTFFNSFSVSYSSCCNRIYSSEPALLTENSLACMTSMMLLSPTRPQFMDNSIAACQCVCSLDLYTRTDLSVAAGAPISIHDAEQWPSSPSACHLMAHSHTQSGSILGVVE